MEEGGAAVVVPDAELDAGRLSAEVRALLADPPRLERMGMAAKALSRPDAAQQIAAGILEVARSRSSAV
jgi:UDP-N-acetylglucosamine--N-acetylmuramyl-(pentapeptide) pyrophosphoryl-undecaprenol N-acetylglucosamine transferase